MGLSNRDYLSDDGDGPDWGSSWNPGRPSGPMPMATRLVVVTVVTFLVVAFSPPGSGLLENLSLSRDGLLSGKIWQLVTYAFVGPPPALLSLVFGMLILYQCGRTIEPSLGAGEFLALYLTLSLIGGGLHAAVLSSTAMSWWGPVMALIAIDALRDPHQQIRFMFVLPMERWVSAVLFIVLIGLFGGVSLPALAGGLIFAYLYERNGWRITSLSGGVWMPRRKPKLRVFTPEPEEEDSESALSGKVDAILAKIHEHGEASLTGKERRLLKKASEKYKNRM